MSFRLRALVGGVPLWTGAPTGFDFDPGGGGLIGDFSSVRRYVPRFSPVTGRSYNSATGMLQGEPFTPNRLVSGNEVPFEDQGSAGANRTALQNIITNIGSDAARVLIAPGVVIGDMIRVPNHNHVGVGLSIESAAIKAGTFKGSGQLVTGADKALMPSLQFEQGGYGVANPQGNPETRTVFSLEGSVSNVRFRGLHLQYSAAFAASLPNLVGVSGGAAAGGSLGSRSGLISSILDEVTRGVPSRISVEQCFIEGAEEKALLRGVFINGDDLLFEGNWFDNIHYRGNDSQCIIATDYGRRVIVRSNYFAQAFGESVMTGGGTTSGPGNIPCDWLVELNHFDNPTRFIARGYDQKNLLEWKTMLRSEVSRNRFTGYRGTNYDGQLAAIVVKCITQNNGPDFWNQTRDALFRCNEVIDCRSFLSIAGDRDSVQPSNPNPLQPDEGTNRVEIAHNRVYFTDRQAYAEQAGRQITTSLKGRTEAQRQRDIAIHHNSIAGPQSPSGYKAIWLDAANDSGSSPVTPVRLVGLETQANVFSYDDASIPDFPGAYFLRDTLAFDAKSNWDYYTDKVRSAWDHNALVGGAMPGGSLIPTDLAFATRAAAGLANDHRMTGGSPLLTADLDGGPVGVDHALLDAAMVGVVSGA